MSFARRITTPNGIEEMSKRRRRRSKGPFLRQWGDIPVAEQIRLRWRWQRFSWNDTRKGAFLLSKRIAFDCEKDIENFNRRSPVRSITIYKGSPAKRLAAIRQRYIPVSNARLVPGLDPLDAEPGIVAREIWTLNRRLKPAIAGFVLAAQPLVYDGRFKGFELWQAAVLNGGKSKIKIKVIARADDVFGVTRFTAAATASTAQRQLEELLGIMSARLFREQGQPMLVSFDGGKWRVA